MDTFAVTLSEHSVFGWKFNLYSAQPDASARGSVKLLHVPNANKEEIRRNMPESVLRLIVLINETSDRELMKAYSKSNSTVALKDEITKNVFEQLVRPRIEAVNRKIIEALEQTTIPVYLRKDIANALLYEHDRIYLQPSPACCTFHFTRDVYCLRYAITLTNNGQAITLNGCRHAVISDKPGIILIGKNIHRIAQVEARKLTPFFTKEYVQTPLLSEETYLRNFVCKIMLQHEVHIEGYTVRELHPDKHAYLSLERDLQQNLTLILSFGYGENTRIYPDNTRRKWVDLNRDGDAYVISWYTRDREWEESLIDLLQQEGLTKKGTQHFYTTGDASAFRLLEWLNRKDDVLKNAHFIVEQQLEKTYYTGAIALQSSYEEKPDWFDVQATVVIGTYHYPLSHFRKYILNDRREYVLPDQTVFVLPDEWFEKYTELFMYSWDADDALRLKKMHVQSLTLAMRETLPDPDARTLKHFLTVPDTHPDPPTHLADVLRPYQREGFYWLEHLYKYRFGGCLADDMGLGKTIQTIALLQYVYAPQETESHVQTGAQLSLFAAPQSRLPASLVVAPTSLLHNWHNELRRFAPQLRVLIYAGVNRLRTANIDRLFDRYQVVITSYGTVRNDVEYLRRYTFRMLILDESQYIKNPDSQAYQTVKQLSAYHRLTLTGTPIENSLDDLWAQFNFINEGFLGSYSAFRKRFILPIVKDGNERQEARLKTLIAPFLLRRTKEQVTPDLPPLQQEIIYCDMTEAQESIYHSERNRLRNMFLQAMDTPEQHNNLIALEGLNRLRQIANHPQMIFPDYADDSGKFEQVLLAFENLQAAGHKALIFSSYVKHLQLFAAAFDAKGWAYTMLTGATPAETRQTVIRRFIAEADVHGFFISLKAGGVGLNLTAADYVFILDPWWNPAAEMQALSRAHRIGQDKPVIACRFISANTVEEKIIRLQEAKSSLAETFVNASNPFAQFNWEEIASLLE